MRTFANTLRSRTSDKIGAEKVGTDEDLMRDLRGTKKEAERAFTALYGKYSQRIYAFVLRMNGDVHQSQDLLQETFLKFYNAAQHDLVIMNPCGFLMMIARNLCLNHKRDSHQTLPIDGLEFPSEEKNFEQDDLLGLINLALEILDTDYREAFVLKYYQGYSYEEMAMLTGLTIPALKNRVWRGKEQIKVVLSRYILEVRNS